ncbi:hypothetical protein QA540_10960 (plasmid) [Macrococcus psychrotolerans]|uniref:Uncharacterized protein n=1 Tax=Macrococcus psychrotolerans TaxID=3039389 RepID=A0AAU6RJK8_9STAP
MKYLILKLSDKEQGIPFNDRAELKKRAEGDWKLTLKTLGQTDRALLLFRGQVLGEYEIQDQFYFDRSTGRVTLSLVEIDNSSMLNKVLDYPTANPASILDEKDLKEKQTD